MGEHRQRHGPPIISIGPWKYSWDVGGCNACANRHIRSGNVAPGTVPHTVVEVVFSHTTVRMCPDVLRRFIEQMPDYRLRAEGLLLSVGLPVPP